MVVYTPAPESDYASVAAAVADSRGDRVATDLPTDADEPVVYVAPPERLDESELLALQRRLDADPSNKFGVVTGRTPSSARALYDREPDRRDRHAMLFRKTDRDWFSYDDETTVLCGEDATVESLRELLDDGLDSLSLFTNGWPLHLYFDDGFVCGFPTDPDAASFEGDQPFCVRDGERDCPLEGKLLPADEMAVSHAFLPACSSVIPNHPSGMPVNVGMGLLENAASLVGTNRMGTFLPQEAPLHYGLLRAGYDVAERCYVLNRNAAKATAEPFQYFPFGRPSAALPGGRSGEWDATVESTTDGVRLSLTDVDAPVVDVTFDAHRLGDGQFAGGQFAGDRFDGGEVYVRNCTDELADAPLYYTAFREGDSIRVLVYTWGRMVLDRLDLRVAPTPVRAAERTIVADAFRNARGLERLGLLDGKASGQLNDLGNQLGGLPKHLHAEAYDLDAYRDIADRIDRLVSLIDNVRDRIVAGLDPGGAQTPTYHDRTRLAADGATADECYCCGRPVYRRRLSDVTGVVAREKGVCPRCGQIYDAPVRDGEVSYPRLEGDLFGVEADAHPLGVTFTNPRDVPMRATFVPYFMTTDGEFKGIERFDPSSVTRTLAPGETASVEFDLDLSSVPPNKHGFYCYVVGNLDLYVGLHPMVVGETLGHVRTELLVDDHPLATRFD